MNMNDKPVPASIECQSEIDKDLVRSYYGDLGAFYRVRAAVTALEWMPMSTAPKDAEIIGQESDGRIFNLRWEPDDAGENWYDVHGDQIAYPIRWMPIPPRTE